MKKEMYLKQFSKEMEYEAGKLYNYFEISREYEIISYTEEFYTPDFWKRLTDKIEGVCVYTFGVFKESDRRQIAFVPEKYLKQNSIHKENKEEIINFLEFPCRFLKIEINSKFREYGHKDFLGSLMGLNIKRELMGDLILEDRAGYIPVSEKISEVILKDLNRIGQAPCKISEIDTDTDKIPSYRYDDRIIAVSSRRLDSIVSAITNLSRTKIVDPIEKGKILIDYREEKDKSRKIEIGALITIRGYGKFKLFSEKGETKKGKERLLIKKYI